MRKSAPQRCVLHAQWCARRLVRVWFASRLPPSPIPNPGKLPDTIGYQFQTQPRPVYMLLGLIHVANRGVSSKVNSLGLDIMHTPPPPFPQILTPEKPVETSTRHWLVREQCSQTVRRSKTIHTHNPATHLIARELRWADGQCSSDQSQTLSPE